MDADGAQVRSTPAHTICHIPHRHGSPITAPTQTSACTIEGRRKVRTHTQKHSHTTHENADAQVRE